MTNHTSEFTVLPVPEKPWEDPGLCSEQFTSPSITTKRQRLPIKTDCFFQILLD